MGLSSSVIFLLFASFFLFARYSDPIGRFEMLIFCIDLRFSACSGSRLDVLSLHTCVTCNGLHMIMYLYGLYQY